MPDISGATFHHVVSAKDGHLLVDAGALAVDVRPRASQERDGVAKRAIGTDRNNVAAYFGDGSAERHAELGAKDQPIVLLCGSLYGSQPVLQQLAERGYTRLYQVEGGYRAWTHEHASRAEAGAAGA